MSNIPVVESIRSAIARSSVADSGGIIASRVREALSLDGYALVQRAKKKRLQELLDVIYVDKRKTNAVNALDEARKLARSL